MIQLSGLGQRTAEVHPKRQLFHVLQRTQTLGTLAAWTQPSIASSNRCDLRDGHLCSSHRAGPVTVYRLVAAGTIEERIVELHHKKRDLADSLLDDTHRAATLSTEESKALLSESSFA